jgi:hypothetical protein
MQSPEVTSCITLLHSARHQMASSEIMIPFDRPVVPELSRMLTILRRANSACRSSLMPPCLSLIISTAATPGHVNTFNRDVAMTGEMR